MQSIQPYLIFDGNCREAMTFYHSVLGGELEIMTFADIATMDPGSEPPADGGDRVMHACVSGGGAELMASDSMPGQGVVQGDAVWLYLSCDSDAQVAERYRALVEGGSEVQAPQDVFWGAHFAMLNDRFGNHWMISHDKRETAS